MVRVWKEAKLHKNPPKVTKGNVHMSLMMAGVCFHSLILFYFHCHASLLNLKRKRSLRESLSSSFSTALTDIEITASMIQMDATLWRLRLAFNLNYCSVA